MAYLPKPIAKNLIPAYEREYTELCGNWNSLEKKAQLTAGAAGTVLTALLALVGAKLIPMTDFVVWYFPIIALSLLASGFCALKALWVSNETLPPAGEDLRAEAWKLKDDDPNQWHEKYQTEALHLRVIHWDQACKDLHNSTSKKGTWVARAQGGLLLTGVLIFVLIIALCRYWW